MLLFEKYAFPVESKRTYVAVEEKSISPSLTIVFEIDDSC